MELEVVDILKITGKIGLCYMVKSFDGWETIKTFIATGKASGNFTIIERDKFRSAFLKNNGDPVYIGFIATPVDVNTINIKTEYTGSINPKIGLLDMAVSIGDYSMNSGELEENQFSILNTIINNQIKNT